MRVQEITSGKNELYKEILKLKQKKYRIRTGKFLIEGIKLVKHAIEQNQSVDHVFIQKSSLSDDALAEITQCLPEETTLISLTKDLFEGLSDTVNSQGIIAVAEIPNGITTLDPEGIYIALDHIQDPGNLGTMIRTADAAGLSGLIYSKGTVDPYGEKVLRSTMGSIFSLPLLNVEHLPELLADAKKMGMRVYCTSLQDSTDYSEADYKGGVIIVIGNESQGVSEDVFAEATDRLKIPIYGQAESLNAAVAAAIVMYEAVRQRRN